MKPYALSTFAGASCLLATYSLTREGSILLALNVVVVIGGACGLVAVVVNGGKGNLYIGFLTLSFAFGAFVSEVVAFACDYYTHGYEDPKLGVGEAVSIFEFGVIAVVGGLATFASAVVAKRLSTERSRRMAQKRAAP